MEPNIFMCIPYFGAYNSITHYHALVQSLPQHLHMTHSQSVSFCTYYSRLSASYSQGQYMTTYVNS